MTLVLDYTTGCSLHMNNIGITRSYAVGRVLSDREVPNSLQLPVARVSNSCLTLESVGKSHSEITSSIQERYDGLYAVKKDSISLSEDIKGITKRDVISLLESVRDIPSLKEQSRSLSRRSDLFDKLILTKGPGGQEGTNWVLRLHLFPVQHKGEHVLSNLGQKVEDGDANIHFHRWDLSSRFLQGGFVNRQYAVASSGQEKDKLSEFGLVATRDNTSHNTRAAEYKGYKYVTQTASELYRKGDLIHYPIETAHSVDVSGAPFLGITMTLAHTGEDLKDTSSFFKKRLTDTVAQIEYSDEEHTIAINKAITLLKLIELTDELSKLGPGFERYSHPNSLESEVIPTIAMKILQEEQGGAFSEGRMDDVAKKTSEVIDSWIQSGSIDKNSLASLIKSSQNNLFNKDFVVSIDELTDVSREEIDRRNYTKPRDVLSEL